MTGAAFTAFLAALIAAHLFRCAAAMRLRMAALIFRFLAGGAAFFAASAGVGFTAFLTAAQRFRCASPIRLRPAALMVLLRLMGEDPADFPPDTRASKARACWRRAISESIEERISLMFMAVSVTQAAARLAV